VFSGCHVCFFGTEEDVVETGVVTLLFHLLDHQLFLLYQLVVTDLNGCFKLHYLNLVTDFEV